MTARLLPVRSDEWSAFLDPVRHDFYHLPAYAAVSAGHEAGEPMALLVEGDRGGLLLPLIARDTGTGGRDAVSPYGYPGPLASGAVAGGLERDALAEGIGALREAGFVSLFVRYHPLLNGEPPGGIGTAVRQGDTVVVDLSLSEPKLWQETRENHRRNITRARSLGYVARMDSSWGCFEGFKRLYAITMDRIAASPFYRFNDAYFEGLREALGESLHLAVVEKGDDLAAAALYVETDGIVEYHLSGYADEHADVQPTKLLMDFARRWSKARGNRYLHLGGGVGAQRDSLFAFKQGFSPLLRPYWTLRVVIDEQRYRELVAARGQSLVADVADGYFPLYRAPE
jgi:phage replication-related protein YjqB (UPF0714/DUF867 family)